MTDDLEPQAGPDAGFPRRQPRPRRIIGARMATGVVSAGLLAGGVAGGYLVSQAASTTATPAPATGSSGSTTAPSNGSSGTFHSNENATHEAGESAQREAQENAGQMPTVP